MTEFTLIRVGLSLPCRIPVVPGTPNTDAPDEQKTECCATDAWWNINGFYPICDGHLRLALPLMGDTYEAATAGFRPRFQFPNENEQKPWSERHRYTDAIEERHAFLAKAKA